MTTVEISKKLGISRATVSRVLNNNPNVKPETREMVLQALEESGYSPYAPSRNRLLQKRTKIGVIVFSQPASFWEQIKKGVDRAEKELEPYGIQLGYFVTDILRPQEQIDTIQRLVDEGYQGIALAPNDPPLLSDAVDYAIEQGVSVVLFNVDIPNVNRMAFVGSDYTRAGMLAAEILAKNTAQKQSRVAIMTLEESLLPIEQRTTGFRLALADFPWMRISSVCRFPRVGGDLYQRTCQLIKEGETDAIFVTFGELEEAAKALQDQGVAGEISLVGYDLDSQIYHYLQTGTITAVIGHEVQEQSRLALHILSNYLHKGELPPQSLNYSKLEVIMRYNADYYLR